MKAETPTVYVVDAWDDDAQESCVRVFSTREKDARDREQWTAKRQAHDVSAGIVTRKML